MIKLTDQDKDLAFDLSFEGFIVKSLYQTICNLSRQLTFFHVNSVLGYEDTNLIKS